MNTLSPVVEAIGELHFEGNIIPHSWFQHAMLRSDAEKRPKPHNVAIHLLADVIYWYRPMIIRDETTGRVIERRQRFEAHRWRIDYQQWANHFGYGKRQVQDAAAFLKRRGIVRIEVTDYVTPSGYMIHNAVFIEPVVEKIAELNQLVNEATPGPRKRDVAKNRDISTAVSHVAKQRDISPENLDSPEVTNGFPPKNGTYPTKVRVPRTESTYETTAQQHTTIENGMVEEDDVVERVTEETNGHDVVRQMIELGVTETVARRLFQSAPDTCAAQVEYLPHRKGRTNKAATLVKAIKEEWAAPEPWQEAEETRRQAAAAREAAARRDVNKAREAEQRAAMDAANDILDKMWEQLDAANQARIDADARARLGILGRSGSSVGALQAMRRSLLRERLLQLAQEQG